MNIENPDKLKPAVVSVIDDNEPRKGCNNVKNDYSTHNVLSSNLRMCGAKIVSGQKTKFVKNI
jgi:hypothetical protein